MSTKIEVVPCHSSEAATGAETTRRSVFIALPITAALAGSARWDPRLAESEDVSPVGDEAALLAVEARTASWSRPNGFAEAMLKHWMRTHATRLLTSYAAIYLARFHDEPRAVHMLAAADRIFLSLRSPIYPGNTWTIWGNPKGRGLDPSKFERLWRRARLIELEQHGALVARLRSTVVTLPMAPGRGSGSAPC